MFNACPKDKKFTAIFIGGSDIAAGRSAAGGRAQEVLCRFPGVGDARQQRIEHEPLRPPWPAWRIRPRWPARRAVVLAGPARSECAPLSC